MDFKEIIILLSSYGITGSVLITILYGLRFIFKTEWFNLYMNRTIDKIFTKKNKSVTKKDIPIIDDSKITNNPIFDYIDLWLNTRIHSLTFSNDFRTVVFRKYLSIYLLKYKTNLKDYVMSRDYQDMDGEELYNSMIKLLNKTIYDYESELVLIGIPPLVIKKMKESNTQTIMLITDLIEGICHGNIYVGDKNYLKMFSILSIIYSILLNVINNAVPVCNSINGALQGMTFEGEMEPYH